MKYTAALAGLVATVAAQGVTENISPKGGAPSGCSPDYSGSFEISVDAPQKRGLESREALTLTLEGGILKDSQGRTGYIAANYQFQFDKPAQTGAIYTAGFSACSSGLLALGPSTTFYRCKSGGFFNLYNKHWAAQCEPVTLAIVGAGGSSGSGSGSGSATGGVTTVISQESDGQPAVITTTIAPPISQISDGQPQAAPSNIVTVISDGQPQAPTGVITQIADGQPQAPTGVVSQISDGQPQAPTGIVTQISDGQPQAPTGAPNATTSVVPVGPNAGNKVLPGTFAALFVGLVGTMLYL